MGLTKLHLQKVMRGVLALSCAAVAAAASREVHKLRAAQSACTLNRTRGPEPTKRFVVFTKQRSGSRWFVNALALRSNGTFQTHIPEIEFRGFGLREIRRAKGAYAACHSRNPSKRCSCAMRRFFHAHAHSCVEIKFYAMAPSTRRLLDGVALPVPHRSTEPARPRHHREMT